MQQIFMTEGVRTNASRPRRAHSRFGISPAPVTPPGSHYLAMDRMAASMESSQPGGARTDKALIEGSSRSITAPFVFGAQDRGV